MRDDGLLQRARMHRGDSSVARCEPESVAAPTAWAVPVVVPGFRQLEFGALAVLVRAHAKRKGYSPAHAFGVPRQLRQMPVHGEKTEEED